MWRFWGTPSPFSFFKDSKDTIGSKAIKSLNPEILTLFRLMPLALLDHASGYFSNDGGAHYGLMGDRIMEFRKHAKIDLPLERHNEICKFTHSNPLPISEFVVVDRDLGV